MREKGEGYIVNVSSLAAFTASAGVYGASKAFLNYYSESLQGELADTGIKVQSLCPGFTHTEFHARDSMAGFPFEQVPEDMWMKAADVVRESLAALGGDKGVMRMREANLRGENRQPQDLQWGSVLPSRLPLLLLCCGGCCRRGRRLAA